MEKRKDNENAAKMQISFPIVWNGLIEGRVERGQVGNINKLFDVYYDESDEIVQSDINKYIRGCKVIAASLAEKYIAYVSNVSVEDVVKRVKKLLHLSIRTTICAFHHYLLECLNVPACDLQEMEKALRNDDPERYIVFAVLAGVRYREKPKGIDGKLIKKLRTLEQGSDYPDYFAIYQEKTAQQQIPEEEHSISAETKELFQYMSKYVVTRTSLLWELEDEEDLEETFSLSRGETLLLCHPYSSAGYVMDFLADLEEAGLVRRPERFVLFDESDPAEDKPEEVLMNRQKDAIISVVSTMKPYEVEFTFEGCRLTRLGLEKLSSLPEDRGNESFMKTADLLNTLLSPEGFYRVRAYELKMSTQNADGDQLFTLGEELPLREVKSAPETEADDGMPF